MNLPSLMRRRSLLLGLPVMAAVAAAIAVSAGDGADGGPVSTSTTILSGEPTPTSVGTPTTAPPSTTPSSGTAPAPTTTTEPAGPAAPWAGAELPRGQVPEPFLEAWNRAENRGSCALLVPVDAGPEMAAARPSFEPTRDDAGWDIFLIDGGRVLEILGLFGRDAQPEDARPRAFSRTWADGSEARYGPDDPGGPDGTADDPEATAFEAALTVPGQECVYLIYDTLGKSHLEYVLDRLRFVEDTR